MSHASEPPADAQPFGRDIAYRAAADAYWMTSGSTAPAAAPDMSHRRATRTTSGQPLNLSVYDLALDHERTIEEFARAHGRPEDIPSGRTALAAYAAAIAVDQPEVAAEYEARQLASSLAVALTLGDSDDALGRITCPKCLCWMLVPAWEKGGWRAECRNQRCAYDPDPVHDVEDTVAPTATTPRLWSLATVAAHHLAELSEPRYARTA